ncbi:hypothetical protein WJX72_001839 [[Myrmecia] bisecta]|uniref:Uncharacterized protein n=1 Tax=[Myrmecia] bisecta TaxID=41462 RepID=A0AAW1P9V3_9CHLO
MLTELPDDVLGLATVLALCDIWPVRAVIAVNEVMSLVEVLVARQLSLEDCSGCEGDINELVWAEGKRLQDREKTWYPRLSETSERTLGVLGKRPSLMVAAILSLAVLVGLCNAAVSSPHGQTAVPPCLTLAPLALLLCMFAFVFMSVLAAPCGLLAPAVIHRQQRHIKARPASMCGAERTQLAARR